MSSTVQQAASLLLQTPPGQTSKVYHDIRVLLESNGRGASGAGSISDQLKREAQPVLELYNTEQLITVKPPADAATGSTGDKPFIIARAAEVPGQAARYADPKAGLSYAFDHLRLAAADPQPLRVNKAFEKVRAAIDAVVGKYVADHYQDGVTGTYAVIKPDTAKIAAKAAMKAEKLAEKLAEKTRRAAVEAAKTPAIPTAAEGVVNAVEGKEEATTAEDSTKEETKETDETAAEAGAGETAPATKEVEDDPIEAVKVHEEVEASKTTPKAPKEETAAQEEEEQEDEDEDEPEGEPTYVTHIVGNRYNLQNFWAGRWRSSYSFTPSAAGGSSLQASVNVQVHYFEDGNVQLVSSKPAELPLEIPSQSLSVARGESEGQVDDIAKAIGVAIKKHEQAYHQNLNDANNELSERAFKAIRRQLPVTKQKLDWEKALTYKLASELSR